MRRIFAPFILAVAPLLCSIAAVSALGQSAKPPYELTVFANAPAGLSAPDSIAVLDNHVFVGFGDGHPPDGSDGKSSQVVEFAMDGTVLYTYTVTGHNDGLKVDPITHELWALQNEDANTNLVVIDPESHHTKEYVFASFPHGGGYDDIVFRGCEVYISASNPATNPNTGPAIVKARLESGTVEVESLLAGDVNAIDVLTGATVTLNLQDPDSMTLDPYGDIVLDSQGDQELIIVTHPGWPDQQALLLPLSYQTMSGAAPVETDDTAFVTGAAGILLFADKGLNKVFKVSRGTFVPGSVFIAADGGPFVGTLDLTSGVITPVVTALSNPGGMVFVNTAEQQGSSAGKAVACQDRPGDSN